MDLTKQELNAIFCALTQYMSFCDEDDGLAVSYYLLADVESAREKVRKELQENCPAIENL